MVCMNYGGNLSFAMSVITSSRCSIAVSADADAIAPIHILKWLFLSPAGPMAASLLRFPSILSKFSTTTSSGTKVNTSGPIF